MTLSVKKTVLLMCFLLASQAHGQVAGPPTLLMDAEILAATKVKVASGDKEIRPALNELLQRADAMLGEGPYSVTDKQTPPPSGDKHDYVSYSRYWWPDPKQPDGLPYLRRDGETNPDSQDAKKSDRPRIEAIGIHTETLGLAWYLTGEKKYATKAAQLLRVWFLDKETRMNPNLNFAQSKPGHSLGNKSGVLDGRMMTRALEGSLLIADSSALTQAERDGLKAWVAEYYQWLTTNKIALEEAAARNNHGTFYDAQTMYFALYSGNTEGALKIAKQAVERRISSQIKPDGSMPEELARTRPMFYSNYNLHAMFVVAHLCEKVGVDIWNADGARLRAGLDYILPYANPKNRWPHPTVKKNDPMKMFPILLMAARKYPDGNYLEKVEWLPASKRQIRRENLAFPLMR